MEGYLTFKDKEYFFTFNNFILKLIPKKGHYVSIDDLNEIFNRSKVVDIPNFFKGELLDKNEYAYFFIKQEKNHTVNTGVREFEVYAYIESRDEDIEVEKISLRNEELNWFYNIGKSYGVSFVESTGKIDVNIKEHNEVDKNFTFKLDETDIHAGLGISRNIAFKAKKPVTLESTLSYEFTKTKELDFILKLVNLTEEFLSFISYRKNVYINKVSLSKKRADGKYVSCGELFINRDEDMIKESANFIRERIIDFEFIEKRCSNIFQALSDSIIYLNHIPYNSRDLSVITPSRFVLITAAFEWEFRSIYGDVKSDENDIFREVKSEILDFFDDKINSSKGKKKKYIKSYKKFINNSDMSLSEKIVRSLVDNDDILNVFIKSLYQMNGIEDFEYSQMAERLQKQRNNYAHGNIDKELNPLAILDLIVLEWVIYTLILKMCKVEKKYIQKCINKLFKRNIAI